MTRTKLSTAFATCLLVALFSQCPASLYGQASRQYTATQPAANTASNASAIEQILLEKLVQTNPSSLSQAFRPSLLPPLAPGGGSGGGTIIIQPAYSLGSRNAGTQGAALGQTNRGSATQSVSSKANPTGATYQTLPLRSGTAVPGTQQVIRGGNAYDVVPPNPSKNQYDKVTQPLRSGTTQRGGYESISAPLNGTQPARSGQGNRNGGYESVRSPLAGNKTASAGQLQSTSNTGYGVLPNRRAGNGYESMSSPIGGNGAKSGNTLPYLKTPLSYSAGSSQAATGVRSNTPTENGYKPIPSPGSSSGVNKTGPLGSASQQRAYDRVPQGSQRNTYGVVPPARGNSNSGYQSAGSPLGGSSAGSTSPYQQLQLRPSSTSGYNTVPLGKQGGNNAYGVVPPARGNSNSGYQSAGSPLGGSSAGSTSPYQQLQLGPSSTSGYNTAPLGKQGGNNAYGVVPPARGNSNSGYQSAGSPLGGSSAGSTSPYQQLQLRPSSTSGYNTAPLGKQGGNNTYGVVPPARGNSNSGYQSAGSPLGGSSAGSTSPYQQLQLRPSSTSGYNTAPLGKQGGNNTYGVVPPARGNSNSGYQSASSPLGGSNSGKNGYDRVPAGKPSQGGSYGVLPPKRNVSNGGYESVTAPLGNSSNGSTQKGRVVGTTQPSNGAPSTIASPQGSTKGKSVYGPLPKINSNSSSSSTPGSKSSSSGATKKYKSKGKR